MCVYTPQDKWCGYMSVCVCGRVCVHTIGQVVWIHEHVCVYTPQDKWCGYMSMCVCTHHRTAVWIHECMCVWGVCVYYVWSQVCAMEGV